MHAKPKLKPTNKANPNKEVVEKKSFRYENELCQKWIESQEQTVTVRDYILESLEHCSEDTYFCCKVHQRPEVYLATQLVFPIEVTHHNVLSIPEIVGFLIRFHAALLRNFFAISLVCTDSGTFINQDSGNNILAFLSIMLVENSYLLRCSVSLLKENPLAACPMLVTE